MGFSAGGAAAAEACRSDPRFKAGINIDGTIFNPVLLETPLEKPFLMLRADVADTPLPDGRPDDRKAVIEAMARDGYLMRILGSIHISYSDVPLVASPSSVQSNFGSARHPMLDRSRITEIVSTCVLSFMNKYLVNDDDHLLDDPVSRFPEVMEFLRK